MHKTPGNIHAADVEGGFNQAGSMRRWHSPAARHETLMTCTHDRFSRLWHTRCMSG